GVDIRSGIWPELFLQWLDASSQPANSVFRGGEFFPATNAITVDSFPRPVAPADRSFAAQPRTSVEQRSSSPNYRLGNSQSAPDSNEHLATLRAGRPESSIQI